MKSFSLDLLDIGYGSKITILLNKGEYRTGEFRKATDDAILIREKRRVVVGSLMGELPVASIDRNVLISLEDITMISKDNKQNNKGGNK